MAQSAKKNFARTFGQDLMRGEHVVGGRRSAGLAGLAYGINDWVADKTATGDLAGGLSGGHSGTSIFDPVLCELSYRWFCPPGGAVLDPFAGGSVRGVVASCLGLHYTGVELRAEQVAANRAQAHIGSGPEPTWLQGDSREIGSIVAQVQPVDGYDMIFSCPPYADLEVYSDDPADLSTLPYDEFRAAYADIIRHACAMLKPNRFAVFVVGDARGKDGAYYGLPWHTIDAFEKAGLRLYNEAVLVTSVGSLPIRVAKQFRASRKLGKTHQNIIVALKGDAKRATQACAAGDAPAGVPLPVAANDNGGT